MTEQALWTPGPERVAAAALTRFRDRLATTHHELAGCDYARLHAWSLEHNDAFWEAVWDFCGVIGEREGPVSRGETMFSTRFFPDSRLNFAENLLSRGDAEAPALRYRGEDGLKACLSRGELRTAVRNCAAQFKAAGLAPGDRVDKGQPLYELHAETAGELAYALAYAESQTGVLTLSEGVS